MTFYSSHDLSDRISYRKHSWDFPFRGFPNRWAGPVSRHSFPSCRSSCESSAFASRFACNSVRLPRCSVIDPKDVRRSPSRLVADCPTRLQGFWLPPVVRSRSLAVVSLPIGSRSSLGFSSLQGFLLFRLGAAAAGPPLLYFSLRTSCSIRDTKDWISNISSREPFALGVVLQSVEERKSRHFSLSRAPALLSFSSSSPRGGGTFHT